MLKQYGQGGDHMAMRWLIKGIARIRLILAIGWRSIYKLISANRYSASHSVDAGIAQHIGEREEQQDAYGLSPLVGAGEKGQQHIFAVLADGMGGYALGKEAGMLAVETMVSAYAVHSALTSVPKALEQSLQLSNKAVYELALKNELEWNVGTTLIAAVIANGKLNYISAGDSRVYLYRGGVLVALTRDHVYANRLYEQVLAGKLSLEEAESHPERYLLTSYLGIPSVTEIDANQTPLQLLAGDYVLLCSDGLYEDLSEELLEEAFQFSPQAAADYILQYVMAQKRPYQDNATIILLAYR